MFHQFLQQCVRDSGRGLCQNNELTRSTVRADDSSYWARDKTTRKVLHLNTYKVIRNQFWAPLLPGSRTSDPFVSFLLTSLHVRLSLIWAKLEFVIGKVHELCKCYENFFNLKCQSSSVNNDGFLSRPRVRKAG